MDRPLLVQARKDGSRRRGSNVQDGRRVALTSNKESGIRSEACGSGQPKNRDLNLNSKNLHVSSLIGPLLNTNQDFGYL